MAHVNTPSKLVDAFADHFLPELLKTEDFDAFEELVSCDMRNIAAKAMALCLERFDAMLLESIPRGWSVHEHASRRSPGMRECRSRQCACTAYPSGSRYEKNSRFRTTPDWQKHGDPFASPQDSGSAARISRQAAPLCERPPP